MMKQEMTHSMATQHMAEVAKSLDTLSIESIMALLQKEKASRQLQPSNSKSNNNNINSDSIRPDDDSSVASDTSNLGSYTTTCTTTPSKRGVSRSNSIRSTGSSGSKSTCKSASKNTPSSKKKSSKFWKKPRDKPKRPLSAYNIFFKHARSRLLQGLSLEDGCTTTEETTKAAIEAIVANSTLPRVPRNNRKTHGQISFGDLARKIAEEWKSLDPKQRAIYEHYASLDMKRYRKDVSVWKAKNEAQTLAARSNNNNNNNSSSSSSSFSSNSSSTIEGSTISLEASGSSSTNNHANEWNTPQHHNLDTSIRSVSSVTSDLTHDSGNAALPRFQANDNISNSNLSPTNLEVVKKNKQLEGLINGLKKELVAMKVSIETKRNIINTANAISNYNCNYNNASSANANMYMPSFPIGPSVERMKQLHMRRMLKGDFLSPVGGNPVKRNGLEIIEDALDQQTIHASNTRNHSIHVDTGENAADFDPVPLDEVFSLSDFEFDEMGDSST